MSISTVITRGYGTYSNVNEVPPRGYGNYGSGGGGSVMYGPFRRRMGQPGITAKGRPGFGGQVNETGVT